MPMDKEQKSEIKALINVAKKRELNFVRRQIIRAIGEVRLAEAPGSDSCDYAACR
jgi:hypothetical protein